MQRESQEAARARRQLEALLPASSSAPIDPKLAVTDASHDSVSAAVPKQIGRYRVASLLGSGDYFWHWDISLIQELGKVRYWPGG